MAKFNVGVFAVCFLLAFWTAEGARISQIGLRSRSPGQCSVWRCASSLLALVGPPDDVAEGVASLAGLGVDRLCQELQSLTSCVASQLADPECSDIIGYGDRLFYQAVTDVVNYVCSAEGRRLLQAAGQSACVSDRTKIFTVQNQLGTCDRRAQERIDDAEDVSEVGDAICSAIEGYISCLTDSITATCGGDVGTLLNGILTRGFRYYGENHSCSTGQNIALGNLFLRALRSLK